MDGYGNKQWSKTFSGPYKDGAYSVQQTKDGGYVLAGYTNNVNEVGDAYVIKTDAWGNKQWSKTFGGTGSQGFSSVQQTTDGGYIFSGSTSLYDSGMDGELWIVKTDSYGNQRWSKTFNFDYGGWEDCRALYIFGSDIRQTSDGGYIIVADYDAACFSQPISNTLHDEGALIKIDAYGNEKWRKIYDNDDTRIESVQ